MNTLSALSREAANRLSLVTDVPYLEAEWLLAHIFNYSRSRLLAESQTECSESHRNSFLQLVEERLQGKPIAYLLGRKAFWTLDLKVTPAVLIPRPETELLIELVLDQCSSEIIALADLGTGSGAIALALAKERPQWQIDATDQSEEALSVAKENRDRLQLKNVRFFAGDWCQALPSIQYSVIVSNPPYLSLTDPHLCEGDLRFEPLSALVSGQDGLMAIRKIMDEARHKLIKSGALFLEHGCQQGNAVRHLFKEMGFIRVETYRDLAGLERVTRGCILP